VKAIATLIAVTVSAFVLGVGTAKADNCYETCYQNGDQYQCNTYCD
jgi:hypothetical protein